MRRAPGYAQETPFVPGLAYQRELARTTSSYIGSVACVEHAPTRYCQHRATEEAQQESQELADELDLLDVDGG